MELSWVTHKQEVVNLIQTYKPCAVAIKESKLWGNAAVKIAGYNSHNKQGHFNVTSHGGVAIFVHQSIPTEEVAFNTEYKAVAVKVHVPQSITLRSIYLSRSHDVKQIITGPVRTVA